MVWDEIGKVAVLVVGICLCGIGIAGVYLCCLATAEYPRRRRNRRAQRGVMSAAG